MSSEETEKEFSRFLWAEEKGMLTSHGKRVMG